MTDRIVISVDDKDIAEAKAMACEILTARLIDGDPSVLNAALSAVITDLWNAPDGLALLGAVLVAQAGLTLTAMTLAEVAAGKRPMSGDEILALVIRAAHSQGVL